MQLNELKKSMSTLDQVLARTTQDIKINVTESANAQMKLLKRFRQAYTSSAILAVVFAVMWITGVSIETFPSYMKAFLVIYLALATVWYVVLYLRLKRISIAELKPAQLFSKVAMIKLQTLSGEIVFGIGIAVFFTLFISERVISGTAVLCLFFGTLAFALAYGILYIWPQYIRLFRELTSIR